MSEDEKTILKKVDIGHVGLMEGDETQKPALISCGEIMLQSPGESIEILLKGLKEISDNTVLMDYCRGEKKKIPMHYR